MTFPDAYAQLRARWPRQSFSLTHEVWCHDHSDSTGDPPTVTEEYVVWDNETRTHYYGPTMEQAVEQAMGCDADLARPVLPFRDGGGYRIPEPVTPQEIA